MFKWEVECGPLAKEVLFQLDARLTEERSAFFCREEMDILLERPLVKPHAGDAVVLLRDV